MPKTLQPGANALLKGLPYAETQAEWERLRDQFSRRDRALAPQAVER